jgi:transcription-repair coupling factor (superfamily II helicase)
MFQNQEKNLLRSLIDAIPYRNQRSECSGISASQQAYLCTALYRSHPLPMIIAAPSVGSAQQLMEDMDFFAGNTTLPIHFFPASAAGAYKSLSSHSEASTKRICALYQLIYATAPPIVIAPVEGLLQKLIPRQELSNFSELLMENEEISLDRLVEKMISGGYVRSMIVEEPGDYCIRGGILDVFSPLYADPLRIELFGDCVESIRFFSASSQRTIKNIAEAIIIPAREAIIKMESIEPVINRIREQASVLELPVTTLRDLVDRIKKEGVFPGIEFLTPLFYPAMDNLLDYVPQDALLVMVEPGELEKSALAFHDKTVRQYMTSRKNGVLCVAPEALHETWDSLYPAILERHPLILKQVSLAMPDNAGRPFSAVAFSVETNTDIQEKLAAQRDAEQLLLPLAVWINEKKEQGYTTLIVCSTGSQAERLSALLQPYGIMLKLAGGIPDLSTGTGRVYACLGHVSSGFVWPEEALAVISEDEIFGRKYHRKRLPASKVHTEQLIFGELKRGDLVVHTDHGIGQYEGLMKLVVDGATNDFLLITYRDADKLYLPVVRMNMVQKYLGVEGAAPVLDKMGGKSWDRVKKQVKQSVEKIAGELLKLYAGRKVAPGIQYEGIDSYFRDFEGSFSYEETPDQLRAIDDVLQDMQSPAPMDRLVCGDVGYGKTEIALRAAFLAVNNSKQVAVLVPTTVLAEQHFETFSSRFKRYPVRVACLSRFRSAREQKGIIAELKTGTVDIVIGTHRLLQKDVGFKDIGLIVLDEEQRFGVKHKEKLKKFRHNVDVLALTATPIPRTLHMSMMGVRDISIISTPPEHRQPIATFISEFDDTVITEAIRKELERKGQIYFVHNNIHTIWSMSDHLKKLVPEVRLDVAHGRMNSDELEDVMLRFTKNELDMLVCTTIIESGLDIPLANTLLVNRADRFGLAQIYQLRGRVGRSNEQAYAYLFIPAEHTLSPDALKRLKVLMEHSDLGSGFQIAMSDLKIRGGGTILGASQSGHIAAVGYDMFLKLMEEAMSEIKGEPILETLEPDIQITMSAFIPETYIPDIDQRLVAYRRLAKMTSLAEISDYKKEMADRFGALPDEAGNLLLKMMLKVLCTAAGVKRLDLYGRQLHLRFSEAHQKNPFGIVDMIVSEKGRFEFTPDHVLKIHLARRHFSGLLSETKNILKEIGQRVNN